MLGVLGVAAAVAFVLVERRRTRAPDKVSPMLPLDVFASRQFTVINFITFLVYGAFGGLLFLLVLQLQVVSGFSPLAAGTALLPVTLLMLALSARSGSLAQRIGPRWPITVGIILLAIGMALMMRIGPHASYLTDVLPAVFVFGLGLCLTVAPLTATVLASADVRHAGVASGVNNAVARAAGLVAVAALPAAVGLTAASYHEPAQLQPWLRFCDDDLRRHSADRRRAGRVPDRQQRAASGRRASARARGQDQLHDRSAAAAARAATLAVS